jgi:hypothetical protein
MTMLELLDDLVELLRGLQADGEGPVAVEKYRRLEGEGGPVIYVTPLTQREAPEAIGGQYAERLQVEVRLETPWERPSAADADLLVATLGQVLAVLGANREVGDARRGRIGEATYGLRERPGTRPRFYARVPVEFTTQK